MLGWSGLASAKHHPRVASGTRHDTTVKEAHAPAARQWGDGIRVGSLGARCCLSLHRAGQKQGNCATAAALAKVRLVLASAADSVRLSTIGVRFERSHGAEGPPLATNWYVPEPTL